MSVLGQQERALMANELREFFLHPRLLHFLPLTLGGVMLVLWPYFSSPFVPVLIVVFAGLEPQFNNIFFRSPGELESLSVFPVEWTTVVRAKNIATLLLLAAILPLVAAAILYFSPKHVTLAHAGEAVAYVLTVVFPLMHIGNMRSVQHPRRKSGWQIDDLAGVVEFLISMAVFSVPFFIFTGVSDLLLLCPLYFIATSVFWWKYSIRKTADMIETKRIDICLSR